MVGFPIPQKQLENPAFRCIPVFKLGQYQTRKTSVGQKNERLKIILSRTAAKYFLFFMFGFPITKKRYAKN